MKSHRIRLPFFSCTLLSLVSLCSATAAEYYVSAVGGNDANPGSARQPFATIERARDAIRERKQAGGLSEPVTVRLQGGTYRLSGELRFGPEDSGTAACPITYTAAGPEAVMIDGGRRISGWRRHDARLWVADVPEVARGACRFRPFGFRVAAGQLERPTGFRRRTGGNVAPLLQAVLIGHQVIAIQDPAYCRPPTDLAPFLAPPFRPSR